MSNDSIAIIRDCFPEPFLFFLSLRYLSKFCLDFISAALLMLAGPYSFGLVCDGST